MTGRTPLAEPITAERLRELLHYEPMTGVFTWRIKQDSVPAGDRAGCLSRDGYVQIKINQRIYRGHRLAWLYVYGAWPISQLDHKNRDRADNRISNLREATPSQNIANSKTSSLNRSGYKGVFWYRRKRKWWARIRGKHIGYFDTLQEAHVAYRRAAQETYGEFASEA